MAGERGSSEDIETLFGLSRHQQHQAARVVASASVDAEDCAQLLAALGLDPADLSSLDD
jgi:lysophospholipid acyltransferase (LPLAT)-like uncharacterized protein